MRTILVTGGAGFIGSNFVKNMLKWHPEDRIINVDALTYAGNLSNLASVLEDPRHVFICADVRNQTKIDEVFTEYEVSAVINFAAETHVDRSILDPGVFLTTNIIGTQTLLDAAIRHWKLNPQDVYSREYKESVKFIQVSTDEVYGALGEEGLFTETTPLLPNSPYSAAKAGADLLVRAYHETYGIPINITRCSNNYGPYQFPEKLIPLMIRNSIQEKPLPVYGDGMQVRDWLHVDDHCSAIDAVFRRGADGEVYNIGGNNECTNIDLIKMILRALKKPDTLIAYVKDRPGHDRRYAIDNTKITTQLGWKPQFTFVAGMSKTIRWYLEHAEWVEDVVCGAYMQYYEKMYGNRQVMS